MQYLFICLFIYLLIYLFVYLFIYYLSGAGRRVHRTCSWEYLLKLFGGFLDFESNLTRTLHQHKSVEIEVSKTDMTLRYNTTLHLQQGNLKATRTFYLQAHS